MFERFTRSARAAVTAAVGEARRRGDGYVGTEHLLLGVALAPSAEVLHVGGELPLVDDLRAGLTRIDEVALESVGVSFEAQIPVDAMPSGRRRMQHLRFTAGAKSVLEAALDEAVSLGHRHIGPEHILLGLLRRPPYDSASRLLHEVGSSPDELEARLVVFLRRSA